MPTICFQQPLDEFDCLQQRKSHWWFEFRKSKLRYKKAAILCVLQDVILLDLRSLCPRILGISEDTKVLGTSTSDIHLLHGSKQTALPCHAERQNFFRNQDNHKNNKFYSNSTEFLSNLYVVKYDILISIVTAIPRKNTLSVCRYQRSRIHIHLIGQFNITWWGMQEFTAYFRRYLK